MSEKSKNELLDELVASKFITKEEVGLYDNLTKEGLLNLTEKFNLSKSELESKSEDVGPLPEDERLAYETTIENLKLELEEAKKESSNVSPEQDPVYLERRNRQALKKLVQDVELFSKQLVAMAKESIKDKA